MASSKKNDVISVAPPHSIKKFELISEYVKVWINILMLNKKCRGIVYIDCISNSGVYKDDNGEEIKGTPLLVSEIIAEAMTRHTDKQAYIYEDGYEQMTINFETDEIGVDHKEDDAHYTLRDIATYLQRHFRGRQDVPKDEISEYLFEHPVFPVRDYSRKTYNALKKYYDAVVHRNTVTFSDRSC